jgi:hypothetical protein
MHTTGMSFEAIGRQMGYHYTVVSRLVRKYTQTNNVKDLARSGRPRVTSDRDDRHCSVWLDGCNSQPDPYSNNTGFPNRRLSTRTVRNRLKSAGFTSRKVVKRPLLVDRHRRSHLAWSLARRGWNLRNMAQDPLGLEKKNTAYAPRNIQPTVPYGGGSVMVWGVSLMTASWT